MRITRVYPKEYKLECVKIYIESKKRYYKISEELGVPRSILKGWIDKYMDDIKSEEKTMKIIYVYILVLNILIGHQIDASYWHEWEMFQLSGGIELFDCFNLIVFPPFLFGLIYANQPSRFLPFAVSLGLMGFITTLIHIGFYSFGYKQFHLPISAGLIAGAGIGGFYLLSLAISRRHL